MVPKTDTDTRRGRREPLEQRTVVTSRTSEGFLPSAVSGPGGVKYEAGNEVLRPPEPLPNLANY